MLHSRMCIASFVHPWWLTSSTSFALTRHLSLQKQWATCAPPPAPHPREPARQRRPDKLISKHRMLPCLGWSGGGRRAALNPGWQAFSNLSWARTLHLQLFGHLYAQHPICVASLYALSRFQRAWLCQNSTSLVDTAARTVRTCKSRVTALLLLAALFVWPASYFLQHTE